MLMIFIYTFSVWVAAFDTSFVEDTLLQYIEDEELCESTLLINSCCLATCNCNCCIALSLSSS